MGTCSVAFARFRVKCDGYGCENRFFADRLLYADPSLKFCVECKARDSYKVLVLQTKRQQFIRELILEAARMFPTALGMADYLEVSPPTLYGWFRAYFNMDFQEFKRQYICHAKRCMLLDIQSMPIVFKYYVSDTIKRRGSCACFVKFGDNQLMITSASAERLRDIFRNAPVVVSDGTGINRVRYPINSKNLTFDEVLLAKSPSSFGLSPVLQRMLETEEIISERVGD